MTPEERGWSADRFALQQSRWIVQDRPQVYLSAHPVPVNPAVHTAQAVAAMLEKFEICCGILYGFNWGKWTAGAASERLSLIPAGQEHVLKVIRKRSEQRYLISPGFGTN
jgi:hypothetical protein